MSDPITAALIIAGTTLAASGTTTAVQAHQAEAALSHQRHAEERAKEAQEKSDANAEKQRLEALAANQTDTDYGNIWGVDNANKFSDAAQKLSAGTGSFDTDDDDENPFYTRGLL